MKQKRIFVGVAAMTMVVSVVAGASYGLNARVMRLAQEAVRRTGHNMLATEQILLGLIARPITPRPDTQSDSRYDWMLIDIDY